MKHLKKIYGFNYKISKISRLESHTKKEIIDNIHSGSVDIIIGSHALLSNKIKFKNLDL